MNVPHITEVKEKLDGLKSQKLIKDWELPYEDILTRISSAVFFVSLEDDGKAEEVWSELSGVKDFSVRPNEEKKLSELSYRLTFSKEEKEKNESLKEEALADN
ncbi:hypothetical protein JMN32_22725 [Fulvivirga sp. 29W222]|uniref:Uncharacterized protein n=1 Tax=Fulvivirga marina TaxID=2494733 RepID=A0A937FZY1_9BACT|nr:hypothetical protein [Fulvivirga marina]MBL6449144.1 hypothetical protein [Fulvivirga marina]